jgi:uncharacterized membrane protein
MANGNNRSRSCQGWCAPAMIYLVLAVIGLVVSLFTSNKFDATFNQGENKAEIVLVHLVTGVLWTALLYWLCSNCHYTAAWVLLLLPLIFVIMLVIFLLVFMSRDHRHGRRYRRDHHGRLVLENVDTPLGTPEVRRAYYN